MGPEKPKEVLEKLAASDKATIVVERLTDGKMRVTSGSCVILRDEVLEVRNVDGRLHVARKPRGYDEWTRMSRPTIRMARGPSVSGYAGDEAIDR